MTLPDRQLEGRPSNLAEDAAEWDRRLRSAQCAEDDRTAFEAWCEADPARAAAFDDLQSGIRGLKELERRCETDCKAAFAMCPTSLQDLFRVADEGRLMPPKSTWFEPKLLSGLFIHALQA